MHEHPKLTVAAVNGPAVGAGMALALACDFRIAAESARLVTGWARLAFWETSVARGSSPGCSGSRRALELLVSNAALDARDAHALGLVNRVVPDPGFADAWMAWAQELASGPTEAFTGMKANVHDALHLSLAEALPRETGRMVASVAPTTTVRRSAPGGSAARPGTTARRAEPGGRLEKSVTSFPGPGRRRRGPAEDERWATTPRSSSRSVTTTSPPSR